MSAYIPKLIPPSSTASGPSQAPPVNRGGADVTAGGVGQPVTNNQDVRIVEAAPGAEAPQPPVEPAREAFIARAHGAPQTVSTSTMPDTSTPQFSRWVPPQGEAYVATVNSQASDLPPWLGGLGRGLPAGTPVTNEVAQFLPRGAVQNVDLDTVLVASRAPRPRDPACEDRTFAPAGATQAETTFTPCAEEPVSNGGKDLVMLGKGKPKNVNG